MRPKIPKKLHLKPQGVTFTEAEKKELQHFAKQTGKTMSAYIRELTAADKGNRDALLQVIQIKRERSLAKNKWFKPHKQKKK